MSSSGGPDDRTGSGAVGNLGSKELLWYVQRQVPDELDRLLVVAHIALDISLPALARNLERDQRELQTRLDGALQALRAESSGASWLRDLPRVGNHENYQTLVLRLGLRDWFCAQCGRLLAQRGIGRPRRTCSPRCKRLLHEAGGQGWQDDPQPNTAAAGPERVRYTPAECDKLHTILSPIETGQDLWWNPAKQGRDRAMLLLGFLCPIALVPADLAALEMNDVDRTIDGSLRVRLFKRGAGRAMQYIELPADDGSLRPAAAMAAWLSLLRRSGHTSGPLFVDVAGDLPKYPRKLGRPLGRRAIAHAVEHAAWYGMKWYGMKKPFAEFSPTTPFPDFLQQLTMGLTADRDTTS